MQKQLEEFYEMMNTYTRRSFLTYLCRSVLKSIWSASQGNCRVELVPPDSGIEAEDIRYLLIFTTSWWFFSGWFQGWRSSFRSRWSDRMIQKLFTMQTGEVDFSRLHMRRNVRHWSGLLDRNSWCRHLLGVWDRQASLGAIECGSTSVATIISQYNKCSLSADQSSQWGNR